MSSDATGRVLAMLTEIAGSGTPLPTNEGIGRMVGLGPSRVATIINRLIENGKIERLSGRGSNARVFRIASTGMLTTPAISSDFPNLSELAGLTLCPEQMPGLAPDAFSR